MPIINVLLFSGAIQGIFLSVILYSSRHGSRYANRVLALFLSAFSLSILLHILGHGGYLEMLPRHEDVILILAYLYSPLLYLYTVILTGEKIDFKLKYLLHFIPFAAALALSVTIYFFNYFIKQSGSSGEIILSVISIFENIIHIFIIPQCIIYLIKIFMAIRAHSRRIELIYSSTEKVNLRWLRILLVLIISFVSIDGMLFMFFNREHGDVLWLFVSCYMYLIGYFALRQPEIFFFVEQKRDEKDIEEDIEEEIEEDIEQEIEKNVKIKYKKSTLTSSQGAEIRDKLVESLDVFKVYLTEDLSLPALASELSVSVHHLSQVINEHFKMNFFELINSRRIDEAKMLILDKENSVTIVKIAFDVGFNSLSAFNSAFKRFTGKTPSQFKAESLIEDD